MNLDESALALPLRELQAQYRQGRLTSRQVTLAAMSRIRRIDDGLHCVIALHADQALADAGRADAQGLPEDGLVHGAPYGLKDVYDVQGWPTTCQSRVRQGHMAAEDAFVVQRLRQAGAVLLGKLAMHEFALGDLCQGLPHPPARNPRNPAHIPGGSSSGSAAAVAAGYMRFALGTCTGGSIRIPAAWCGVVGLKPTFGRVSRRGVFPLSPSLDHCGPIAASVEEAAAVLQCIAGHDPQDPACSDAPVGDYGAAVHRGVAGLRIGVPTALFQAGQMSQACLSGVARLKEQLASAGASLVPVRFPPYAAFVQCGRTILGFEAAAVHAQGLRDTPALYSPQALARLSAGQGISQDAYRAALRRRASLRQSVDDSLQACDALLAPITLDVAPPFEPLPALADWPAHTYVFNVTGHPAVSVPMGVGRLGLPLAIQVAGRYDDEATVLRVARSIEQLAAG